MSELNARNEQIKRRYLRHLQEARGLAEATIDNALRAIAAYERFTGYKDFGKFCSKDAIAFKKSLLANGGRRAAELTSRSTVRSKLQLVQRFFGWLAEQPGYRTKVLFCDVEYFNLPNADLALSRVRPEKCFPWVEQVHEAIRRMPSETDLEKRDRAVMCGILLTGARVMSVATLKLKHLRPDHRSIHFDAREVWTKFGKTFNVCFFPIGDDIRELFLDYVDHLRTNLRWRGSDPLFPATRQCVGAAAHFHNIGLARRHWRTADPIRRIFRRAFERAGLPYYSPHTIRTTLAMEALRRGLVGEELKAWSQNLAHDDLMTTLCNYTSVSFTRQAEIIGSMGPGVRDERATLTALCRLSHSPDVQRLLSLLSPDHSEKENCNAL